MFKGYMNTVRNKHLIMWSWHPLAWKPLTEVHHWWPLAWHMRALPPVPTWTFQVHPAHCLATRPHSGPVRAAATAEHSITSSIQAPLISLLHGTPLVPCLLLYLENTTYSFKAQHNYSSLSTIIPLSGKLPPNSSLTKKEHATLCKGRPYFTIIVCLHIFFPTRMKVSRPATSHSY